MKKVNKPSYQQLKRSNAELLDMVQRRDQLHVADLSELAKLRREAGQRLDTSMLNERIRLASSIGQMMDTVCQTVKYVIGKEVM